MLSMSAEAICKVGVFGTACSGGASVTVDSFTDPVMTFDVLLDTAA